MSYIIFDLETSDLPEWAKSSWNKYKNVYIVSIAWSVFNKSHKCIKSKDSILKLPGTCKISNGAQKVHGISKDMCQTLGEVPRDILTEFFEDLKTVEKLMSYNLSFDYNVLLTELCRDINYYVESGYYDLMQSVTPDCIMLLAKDALGINKWPKLKDAWIGLCKPTRQELSEVNWHDAKADVEIASMVYRYICENWKLQGVYDRSKLEKFKDILKSIHL